MIARIVQRTDGLWYAQVFTLLGWGEVSRSGYELDIGHTYTYIKHECACNTEGEAVKSLWNKIQNEKAIKNAFDNEKHKMKIVNEGTVFWSKKAVEQLYERITSL